MGAPEAGIEKYLARRAARMGVMCVKLVFDGRRGAPDRMLVHRGQVWFVECKRDRGGVLSAVQQRRQWELAHAGAQVCTVDTRDGVDALLERVVASRGLTLDDAQVGRLGLGAAAGRAQRALDRAMAEPFVLAGGGVGSRGRAPSAPGLSGLSGLEEQADQGGARAGGQGRHDADDDAGRSEDHRGDRGPAA